MSQYTDGWSSTALQLGTVLAQQVVRLGSVSPLSKALVLDTNEG